MDVVQQEAELQRLVAVLRATSGVNVGSVSVGSEAPEALQRRRRSVQCGPSSTISLYGAKYSDWNNAVP